MEFIFQPVIVLSILTLFLHFKRYPKYKNEFRFNYKISTIIILIITLTLIFMNYYHLGVLKNIILLVVLILIIFYIYFELPLIKNWWKDHRPS